MFKSLRAILGFKTKEQRIREEEEQAKKIKVSEAFNKIIGAKTLDELETIRQSMGDACINFGFTLFAQATVIRLNNLEKRVSKLETEVYRGKPIG